MKIEGEVELEVEGLTKNNRKSIILVCEEYSTNTLQMSREQAENTTGNIKNDDKYQHKTPAFARNLTLQFKDNGGTFCSWQFVMSSVSESWQRWVLGPSPGPYFEIKFTKITNIMLYFTDLILWKLIIMKLSFFLPWLSFWHFFFHWKIVNNMWNKFLPFFLFFGQQNKRIFIYILNHFRTRRTISSPIYVK